MFLTGESFAGKQNGNKVDSEEISSKHKDAQVRNFWTLSPLYSLVHCFHCLYLPLWVVIVIRAFPVSMYLFYNELFY